jgi:heme-degrading monooxygenase HmoA
MKTHARAPKVAFVAVWEFYVQPHKSRAFERAYGPQGAWAKLFQAGPGYIRTELIRDLRSANRYMTLDYWQSRRQYETFRKKNGEAYLALDQKCAALTTKETEIGRFIIKW